MVGNCGQSIESLRRTSEVYSPFHISANPPTANDFVPRPEEIATPIEIPKKTGDGGRRFSLLGINIPAFFQQRSKFFVDIRTFIPVGTPTPS